MRSSSLFSSFNARSLEPEQVGDGFIFSPAFVDIAARSNTIVLGPRGSGKTTLLKMLTLPALINWRKRDRSKEGGKLLDSLDYVSIYVPSDFTWYPDFRRPINVRPPKETDDILSYALFRSHVLLAMCETVEHLSDPRLENSPLRRFAIDPDPTKLDLLSTLLAESWEVEVSKIGGVYGLKQGVSRRIRQVQHLLTLTALQSTSAEHLLNSHPFLSAQFFDDLRRFADGFDHVYHSKSRWAACFDEIEIAPSPVKRPIWQSGRSFDARFLIKFSASPYDEELTKLVDPRMPMPGHDFRQVDLSSQTRSEIFRFSERMFMSMGAELKITPRKADAMLGSSFYDDEFSTENEEVERSNDNHVSMDRSVKAGTKGRLAPEGFYNRKFQSLARKDRGFADYISSRGIDLGGMESLSEFRKAAQLRKILSTVIVRDEFLFDRAIDALSSPPRSRRFRARKTVPRIYTGATSIFTICEGNPRWLIGLLRPLLVDLTSSKEGRNLRTVPRALQATRIERTIITLLTLLSTLRGNDDEGDHVLSIVGLVERLGDFSSDQVLGPTFNPEPILSFYIDQNVTESLFNSVGRAINQGALVLLPRKSSGRDDLSGDPSAPGDIRGRRVRLTYLLAPRYRLPLVLGRAVDLSPVLTDLPTESSLQQLVMGDLFTNGGGPDDLE